MTSIILHHFDASPFSEKIRAILGYKKLAWSSVHVPRILPKPDLLTLTGGYRKTPVLQVGCDVYCDTRLIARMLDGWHPDPSLLPAGHAMSVRAIEHVADTQLFLAAIPVLFRPDGRQALVEKLGKAYLERFQQDRAALFTGGSVGRPDAQFSQSAWLPAMAALERQLDAAPFLLGDAPTLADFAVYNPVWYVRGNAGVAATLDAFPNLLAWAERIAAFGNGTPTEMTPQAALNVAAGCDTPEALPEAAAENWAPALSPGKAVTVRASDYGTDAVEGRLLRIGAESMVIERAFGNSATVRMHFPRLGFCIEPLED